MNDRGRVASALPHRHRARPEAQLRLQSVQVECQPETAWQAHVAKVTKPLEKATDHPGGAIPSGRRAKRLRGGGSRCPPRQSTKSFACVPPPPGILAVLLGRSAQPRTHPWQGVRLQRLVPRRLPGARVLRHADTTRTSLQVEIDGVERSAAPGLSILPSSEPSIHGVGMPTRGLTLSRLKAIEGLQAANAVR